MAASPQPRHRRGGPLLQGALPYQHRHLHGRYQPPSAVLETEERLACPPSPVEVRPWHLSGPRAAPATANLRSQVVTGPPHMHGKNLRWSGHESVGNTGANSSRRRHPYHRCTMHIHFCRLGCGSSRLSSQGLRVQGHSVGQQPPLLRPPLTQLGRPWRPRRPEWGDDTVGTSEVARDDQEVAE